MKNVHYGQFEVAQLQKFFFLEFVWASCFQPGIMTMAYMLPKNSILDHFYGQKLHFWQK